MVIFFNDFLYFCGKSHVPFLISKILWAYFLEQFSMATYGNESIQLCVPKAKTGYTSIQTDLSKPEMSSEEPQIAQGCIFTVLISKFSPFQSSHGEPPFDKRGKRRIEGEGRHEAGLQISADYILRNLIFFLLLDEEG